MYTVELLTITTVKRKWYLIPCRGKTSLWGPWRSLAPPPQHNCHMTSYWIWFASWWTNCGIPTFQNDAKVEAALSPFPSPSLPPLLPYPFTFTSPSPFTIFLPLSLSPPSHFLPDVWRLGWDPGPVCAAHGSVCEGPHRPQVLQASEWRKCRQTQKLVQRGESEKSQENPILFQHLKAVSWEVLHWLPAWFQTQVEYLTVMPDEFRYRNKIHMLIRQVRGTYMQSLVVTESLKHTICELKLWVCMWVTLTSWHSLKCFQN